MKYLSLFTLLFLLTSLSGQSIERSVIGSFGHHHNSNIKVDGTIGEVAVSTIKNSSLQLTQGFHQPPKNLSTDVLNNQLDMSIHLWPNPSSDLIYVSVPANISSIQYGIYDHYGRMVKMGELNQETETSIPILELMEGEYFFCLFSLENELVSSQRFIKLK